MSITFELPRALEAHEPPEDRGAARDDVALMVSRTAAGGIRHHRFNDLPGLLYPGDLLVVNNSGTLPSAVPVSDELTVHFSTAMPDGSWLVELRFGGGGQVVADRPAADCASQSCGAGTVPYRGGSPGDQLLLPGAALLRLTGRFTGRLWRARLSTAVVPYLIRYGRPIRYSYVHRAWPIEAYQTVFATVPGSAEMPSAARPFSTEIVTRLVSRGITIAPITLHTGVSSLEDDEEPYAEPYDVPPATTRLVQLTRGNGGRVIAVGTTVVRALETAADSGPASGWTSHVVTPETGPRVVDGLLTGLHEPRSTHLWMLGAFAGEDLLDRCYAEAAERGYRWHEFGDVHLLLP
jgi:S-adenosylmethionine:tRNA ribosyltransferase-isomerase